MLRPILVRIWLSLQISTLIGVAFASFFVILLSNFQFSYVLESGWIVLVVALILVSSHSFYAYGLIRPALELDGEPGFERTSNSQARRALESILEFIPRAALASLFNWFLGGVIAALILKARHPITWLDAFAILLGGVSAGLIMTVIHYISMKLRFHGPISILQQRAGIVSAEDSLFDRYRTSLQSEIQLAFGGLLLVAFLFSFLYGQTQTQQAVVSTLRGQVRHALQRVADNVVLLPGQTPESSDFQKSLLEIGQALPPSEAGGYVLLGADLAPLARSESVSGTDADEISRTMMLQAEERWALTGSGGLAVWISAYGGFLAAFVPEKDLSADTRGRFTTLFSLVALLFGTMLGISYFVAQSVTRPIAELRDSLAALTRGDLTVHGSAGEFGEVGELGLSVAGTTHALRETVGQIRSAHERVRQAGERVAGSADAARRQADQQAGNIRRMLNALSQVERAVAEITNRTEDLGRASGEAGKGTDDLNRTTNDVRESAGEVTDSVGNTNASIFQMAASIRNVAEGMEQLRQSASETAKSVSQLSTSIREVEGDALETATSSRRMLEQAEAGARALSSTLEGIAHIRAASQEAVRTIQALGEQMRSVGSVLDVIGGVAEQTHLLSLNAAIIAAQAGEEGQGFAVVAEEIKKLAVRTAESTKEIGDLLRRIQSQARQGVETVLAGERAVEEGITVSEGAREALSQIERSARDTNERMSRVAQATGVQASEVRRINGAVGQIVQLASGVSRAMAEQQSGADQIAQSSESMRSVAERMDVAARRQGDSTQAIRQSVEHIAEMVGKVLATAREQLSQIETAGLSAKETGALASRTLELSGELREVVVDLSRESDALTEAIARFRF